MSLVTSENQLAYGFKNVRGIDDIFSDFVGNMLDKRKELIEKLRLDVRKMINERKTDDEIYDYIKSFIRTYTKEKESSVREILKTRATLNMLPTGFKPKKYLDFGIGASMVGEHIAKEYELNKNNAFGIDVYDIGPTVNISFMKYSGDVRDKEMLNFLDLKNGKFDLITSFMVLHHVLDVRNVPQFFYDIMNSGGFLVIKEHDAINDDIIVAIDIEHTIFAMMNDNKSPHEYHKDETMIKGHTGHYRSMQEWDNLITKVGFKKVSQMTNSHFMKPNLFRTRHYHAVYYKP